jgi:hypothetical protein
MKTSTLLLLLITALLAACGPSTPTVPPPRITKKIILKIAPVEQRMQFSLFTEPAWAPKTVTVYYLVAKDGTMAEVPLGEFAQYEVGDEYSAEAHVWKAQ